MHPRRLESGIRCAAQPDGDQVERRPAPVARPQQAGEAVVVETAEAGHAEALGFGLEVERVPGQAGPPVQPAVGPRSEPLEAGGDGADEHHDQGSVPGRVLVSRQVTERAARVAGREQPQTHRPLRRAGDLARRPDEIRPQAGAQVAQVLVAARVDSIEPRRQALDLVDEGQGGEALCCRAVGQPAEDVRRPGGAQQAGRVEPVAAAPTPQHGARMRCRP